MRWVLIAFAVFATAGSVGQAHTSASPPLIGANYSHYENLNCSLDDTGIVQKYGQMGVRRRVQAQLGAMRAAGVQTLRLILWHMTERPQPWGIVSSAGGRLSEPYRSSLIRYLSDVRKAGFEQFTLSFGPEYLNAPIPPGPGDVYDPARFDENWQFVRDVRPLLKQYGPASTHVDLINEGVPGNGDSPLVVAQAKDYISKMWSNYVDAFGGEDATFSSIGGGGPEDAASRIQNLVDAVRASGRPLPRWFDVHPPYTYDGTLAVLRTVDKTLSANGLSQSLVISEEAYNDPPVAQAISQFIATSSRPVTEVAEWPLTADRPCRDISVSAPYRVDAYITTLTGSPIPPPTPNPLPLPPIPTLYASVGPSRAISFRTEAGQTVTELDSGQYRIVVRDRSTRDNFHLAGPDVDRRTGLRSRGSGVWTVEIGGSVPYGSRYSYSSDRKGTRLRGSFRIL